MAIFGNFWLFSPLNAILGHFWQSNFFFFLEKWPFFGRFRAVFGHSKPFWPKFKKLFSSKLAIFGVFWLFSPLNANLGQKNYFFQKVNFWPFLGSLKMAKSRIWPFWPKFKIFFFLQKVNFCSFLQFVSSKKFKFCHF